MVIMPSTMLKIGTTMPPFELPDLDGNLHKSKDLRDQPILVVFLCNHCPYVRHIIDSFSEQAKKYQEQGVAIVGISANDVHEFPEDAPDKMKQFATQHDFTFPYLYDESQEVAKTFRAACTPDFFLFNENHRLYYRGRFDDSRPNNDIPVTGKDLTQAIQGMLAGETIPREQIPSVGCNIKWKPGNAPEYFG